MILLPLAIVLLGCVEGTRLVRNYLLCRDTKRSSPTSHPPKLSSIVARDVPLAVLAAAVWGCLHAPGMRWWVFAIVIALAVLVGVEALHHRFSAVRVTEHDLLVQGLLRTRRIPRSSISRALAVDWSQADREGSKKGCWLYDHSGRALVEVGAYERAASILSDLGLNLVGSPELIEDLGRGLVGVYIASWSMLVLALAWVIWATG